MAREREVHEASIFRDRLTVHDGEREANSRSFNDGEREREGDSGQTDGA